MQAAARLPVSHRVVSLNLTKNASKIIPSVRGGMVSGGVDAGTGESGWKWVCANTEDLT